MAERRRGKEAKSLHSLYCSWKGSVAPTLPWQLVHIRGWWNWLCLQKPCGNPLQAFKVQLKCQLQPMMLSDLSSFSEFIWQLWFAPQDLALHYVLFSIILSLYLCLWISCLTYRILSSNLCSYNLNYLRQNWAFNNCCWLDNTCVGHSSHTLEHSFNGQNPIQGTEFIRYGTKDSSFLRVIKKKMKSLPRSSFSLYCPEDLTHIVANHRKGDEAHKGKISRITKNLFSFKSFLYFSFGSTNNHIMYPAFT